MSKIVIEFFYSFLYLINLRKVALFVNNYYNLFCIKNLLTEFIIEL